MAPQQWGMTRDRLEKPAVTPHLSLVGGEGRSRAPRPHQGTQTSPGNTIPPCLIPAHHSLVLHLAQGLAHSRIFDIGVRQGFQDVLLGGQVLLQVHLDLVVLLQLLLKEFLPREGRV